VGSRVLGFGLGFVMWALGFVSEEISVLRRWLSPALRAAFVKEVGQIRRDRQVVRAMIIPPLLQLLLFGTVMSPAVTDLKLGIVDGSRTPVSRDLIAALAESGSFRLQGIYPSANELGTDISDGLLDAGIVIPSDLPRDVGRGRPARIQVLLNAMNANTAAVSEGYIEGILQGFNRSLAAGGVDAGVRQVAATGAPRRGRAVLHPAYLFNPGMVTTWFLVTGLLGQLLLMNGMITSSATMVREREAGTLEQLLMTPARTSEIIIAKIVPPFLLLGIPGLIALAVLRFYFQVPFRGSFTLLAVASAACVFCGIGLGTVVATLTKSAQQAQLSSFFIFPPMIALSGALTPAEAMPAWMQPWAIVNPIYHFGEISRGALIRGGGFPELWPNLAALLIFALVLMSVSVWRFRQQLT